jgi:hypothetical protein
VNHNKEIQNNNLNFVNHNNSGGANDNSYKDPFADEDDEDP